jgi:hypothetical protein
MSRFTISRRTGWALGLAVALSAACADQGTRQLTTRPVPVAGEGEGAAQRKVVLFRAVVDADGRPLDGPWTLHLSGLRLFSVVGPANGRVASRSSFEPGWLDAVSSDDGWAFLALPPGQYELAFEGMAIRFTMPGSQYIGSDATVPIGRSPPVVFVVPPDARLYYIGTFDFTCERVMNRAESLRLECTNLAIRNEAELARQVAQRSLNEYGPMQEAAAAPAEQQR